MLTQPHAVVRSHLVTRIMILPRYGGLLGEFAFYPLARFSDEDGMANAEQAIEHGRRDHLIAVGGPATWPY